MSENLNVRKYTRIAEAPELDLRVESTYFATFDENENIATPDFYNFEVCTKIIQNGIEFDISKNTQVFVCLLMLRPRKHYLNNEWVFGFDAGKKRNTAKTELIDKLGYEIFNTLFYTHKTHPIYFKLDVEEIEERDGNPYYDKTEIVERYGDIPVPKIAYSYWDSKKNRWSPPKIMNYYDAKSAGGGYDGVRSVWVLYNEKEKSILRVMNDTDKKSFAAFMPEHFLDTDTDNDDANMFSEHINDFHFECIDQLKIIIEEKLNAISEENNNNSEQAQERFVALLETDWKPLLAFQYWNDTLQQWSIPYAIPASAAKQAGKGNFSGFKPIWVWYDEKSNTIKRPLTDDERKIWLLPDDYRDSNLTGKAAEIYKQELYYRECLQLQIEMMKELKEKELNNSGYKDLVTESRIYPPKTNDETGTDQDNN